MSRLTFRSILLLLAIAISGPLYAQDYNDFKVMSGAMCSPYTSSPSPDYSKLRFRADGVTNESNGYLYVVCAPTRDSEQSWGYGDDNATASYDIYFRANTVGTDQCTLTVGTTAYGSNTYTGSVEGIVGQTVTINFSGVVANFAESPGTLVCRIAPKHTLSLIEINEVDVRTDGYVYTAP
jgi:hypothetical protein